MRSIGREEVQRLISEGAQLIEVLPKREFGEEHLAGAINLPLKELTPERAAQLDRDRAIIVYCFDQQ
jgi:rhodanese-related sulfurtransferase